MSFFISRVAPIFKDWQFQAVSEGISEKEWMEVVEKMDQLHPLEENERYNLVSIQNAEFFIHFWHTTQYGHAVIFSGFPERNKGEMIKYLFQICQQLCANIYSLDNDGQTANQFDFSKYEAEIKATYHPITEKRVTTVEVSEMMGLMCIPTTNTTAIAEFLNLQKGDKTSWEEAVQKCYSPNNYMLRTIKGWTIVIGQLEPLRIKFQKELDQTKSDKEQFLDVLNLLSLKYERVSYHFNASKYAYFERFISEKGKLVYKSIHADGEDETEGEHKTGYFDEFLALCYDQSILEGIQLYK